MSSKRSIVSGVSCSRLVAGPHGEILVEITTPSLHFEVGERFRLLGDQILCNVSGDQRMFSFTGRSGRTPTPRERAEARPPYDPHSARRERRRREPDDDEITDLQAIEWARREQQRNPPDLIAA